MRTLVIGDSFVARLSRRQIQLSGGGRVSWQGIRGGKLGGLISALNSFQYRRRFPTTIIIHVGSNDIFEIEQLVLRDRVKSILESVRELYPWSRIIWSDILVRAFYLGEDSEGAGMRTVENVNKAAHMVCKGMQNAYFIRHFGIRPDDHDMYIYDGTHLSPEGNQRLVQDWSNALDLFNSHPDEEGYPIVVPNYNQDYYQYYY